MMNRLFFFFVIFNFTNNLYSQSLSSNVLANSGDFVVNENSVSSTIGESLVFTNSQNNYFLYQGFQNTAIAVNEQLFFRILTYPLDGVIGQRIYLQKIQKCQIYLVL